MQLFSTSYNLYTQSGSTIATFDSASGISFTKDFIPTWTKNNSASQIIYSMKKSRLLRLLCPQIPVHQPFQLHGITDYIQLSPGQL